MKLLVCLRPFSRPLSMAGRGEKSGGQRGGGCWEGRGDGLDHRLQKSRIICTFSIEEKVRAIRQLKEEAIIPDEDRWLVLVG